MYGLMTSTREKSFTEYITLYKTVSILKTEESSTIFFSLIDLFEELCNKSQHSHKGKYINLTQCQC